jgi:hypothetical protein
MARFIEGNKLNTEVERIFKEADSRIVLISPYIKLHDRYASTLLAKSQNPKIEVVVVFGKNEGDYARSMGQADFNFFKEFPNIEIRYEKRLHAKYYANDYSAVITSMNLYDYSQNNNIEAGVWTEPGVFRTDGVDKDAYEYFNRVINQSRLLYKKAPKFENKLLGLSSKYIESVVEKDDLSDFFAGNTKHEEVTYNRTEFEKTKTKLTERRDSVKWGYCIRTGKQIPFNPERPMCDEAYKSWSYYGNEDYEENFCHFSGEPSNGQTSYARPILRKNWYKAKEMHNL